MDAGDDEAALVSVPPYHVAGVATILTSVYGGRRLVYLPQFDAEAWVDAGRRRGHHPRHGGADHAGPDPRRARARGEKLPRCVHLSYGGGRMPVPVIERAMELLPHVGFVNAYGLTETSSTIAVLGPDDHRAAFASDDPAVRARLGSVGRPLPSVELEIRGPRRDSRCPAGEHGRGLGARRAGVGRVPGPQRCSPTTAGSPPTTAAGSTTAGYLFIDGRLDDVIVRGGENLSPGRDRGRRCVAHPAVADAAVVGVPDDEWGEAVAAAVVSTPEPTRPPPRSCRTGCGPGCVPPEPRRSSSSRDELPYNETGKLLRRVLKAELLGRPAS